MLEDLHKSIESAKKILVTSHFSPDPDAVSSLLLMGGALLENFDDKTIQMVLEEEPVNLDFLEGYNQIQFKPVFEALNEFRPDLIILLDGNSYDRVSRHNGAKIRERVKEDGIKTVVIDHHEPDGADSPDIYINRGSAAVAQDVYEICYVDLRLREPESAAQTAMVGLYADSGGFAYILHGSEERFFAFVELLLEKGANIEKAKNSLSHYSPQAMKALGELINNVSYERDYTYSFLSDEFHADWIKGGQTQIALQPATGAFLDEYIRNIEDRQWGFIVYKNILQGEDMYSVSLRSAAGVRDVAKIAGMLGGGGHKPAAGAKFPARNIEDAIAKVKQAIANS